MTKPTKNMFGDKQKTNNRQLEAQLVQKPFAKALRQMIDTGWLFRQNPDLELFEFTSLANTWAGSAAKGKIMKDMGVKAGWLDLTFIIKFRAEMAFVAFLEAKYDSYPSESQKVFIGHLNRSGIRNAIFKSPQEGYAALRSWGIKC